MNHIFTQGFSNTQLHGKWRVKLDSVVAPGVFGADGPVSSGT
jgi:hypothetical protein